MRKFNSFLLATLFAGSIFYSCDNADVAPQEEPISADVLSKISNLGFSTDGAMRFEQGYLVENDIYLTDGDIARMSKPNYLPNLEQYSTNELVCGPRVITMYAQEESTSGGGKGKKGGGGGGAYSPAMIAGLDEAIARYNAQNLSISFQRVTSATNADIVMTRLGKRDESRGVLGSAGFPNNCEPYGQIKMSGVLESNYGLSTDGIATIIAHEMGHCIGFRHTDFFDRSISCGGSPSNEGDGGVGANHIPGTPTGASANQKSWMLACTDGGNRPFNNDDKTALDYLY